MRVHHCRRQASVGGETSALRVLSSRTRLFRGGTPQRRVWLYVGVVGFFHGEKLKTWSSSLVVIGDMSLSSETCRETGTKTL